MQYESKRVKRNKQNDLADAFLPFGIRNFLFKTLLGYGAWKQTLGDYILVTLDQGSLFKLFLAKQLVHTIQIYLRIFLLENV